MNVLAVRHEILLSSAAVYRSSAIYLDTTCCRNTYYRRAEADPTGHTGGTTYYISSELAIAVGLLHIANDGRRCVDLADGDIIVRRRRSAIGNALTSLLLSYCSAADRRQTA